MITLTVYLGFGRLPQHILTAEEIVNWQKAYEYTQRYREKGEVFYARCLAYNYLKCGYGDCLCGHDAEVS